RAEDPTAEIRTTIESLNSLMVTDPSKSLAQVGYPFLMADRVYLFEFELQREMGKPVSVSDFIKPSPQFVKVETFKAGKTPAGDAGYLKGMTAFVERLGWQDSAWLAKTTIRYKLNQDTSKDYEDKHYYLVRRIGNQWKIYGWVTASEMHEEGG
ncbi:MAG: hypothetical protein ACAI44_30695, partial [Candidatus Sericytochromatia bacterium]